MAVTIGNLLLQLHKDTEKGELLPALKNKFLSPYIVYSQRDNCKVRVMQRQTHASEMIICLQDLQHWGRTALP